MKNNIITSAITIMCVLCGGWISGAFAAPSVRALGGAGTYAGTTSAAAARTGGTTATTSARAGSVRVTPSVKVSTSTTPRISNSGTSVSTSDDQRMSIGKYLGPSVTGGANVSAAASAAAESLGEQVEYLTGEIDSLVGRLTAVEKNDVLAFPDDTDDAVYVMDGNAKQWRKLEVVEQWDN